MAVKNLATKPITKLSGMKITEISLVDDGACPGADVILMKRQVDSAVSDAIELLKRGKSGFNVEEPRDERGRWIHEAVDLLRQGAKGTKEALQPAARQAVSLLQEGGRYLRDALPSEVGAGVKAATVALHGHAKTAANAVAEHVNGALGTGVHAIKTTQVTAVRPVEGGGVQFSFAHGLGNAGTLKTHVQVRPEHVKGGSGEHALHVLHRYLSSREDLKAVEPFTSTEERDNLDWFRYSHSPAVQQYNPVPGSGGNGGYTMFPAARDTQRMMEPQEFRHQGTGLPGYIWADRREPDDSLRARRAVRQEGTWETSRGSSYTMKHGAQTFIPAARPDVQRHMERVSNWMNSNREAGHRARQLMTHATPLQANGQEYFTPEGDYIPRGGLSWQQGIVDQYARHRQGRPVTATDTSDLPGHMGGNTPSMFRAPPSHQTAMSLTPSEAEVLGDHIMDVAHRNGGKIPSHLAPLMHRSETAAQENADLSLTQEDVNTAWRSLNENRSHESGAGGNARRQLRHRLGA